MKIAHVLLLSLDDFNTNVFESGPQKIYTDNRLTATKIASCFKWRPHTYQMIHKAHNTNEKKLPNYLWSEVKIEKKDAMKETETDVDTNESFQLIMLDLWWKPI